MTLYKTMTPTIPVAPTQQASMLIGLDGWLSIKEQIGKHLSHRQNY
jgi:hypothetical protein